MIVYNKPMNGQKVFYGEAFLDIDAVKQLMNFDDAVGSIECYGTPLTEWQLESLMEDVLPDLQEIKSRGIMHLFWPRDVLEHQNTYPKCSLFYGVLVEPSSLQPNERFRSATPHDPLEYLSVFSELQDVTDMTCILFDFDDKTMDILE